MTPESSGSYYEINSEWIDQSNYRTSIFVKQITTFLVNIAILFTIIGTIIVKCSGMSYVRKLSFCAGIVIIAALSFFTLTFTPFSEDDTTSNRLKLIVLQVILSVLGHLDLLNSVQIKILIYIQENLSQIRFF